MNDHHSSFTFLQFRRCLHHLNLLFEFILLFLVKIGTFAQSLFVFQTWLLICLFRIYYYKFWADSFSNWLSSLMWGMLQKFILFYRVNTCFRRVQLLLFVRLSSIYTTLRLFLKNICCLMELICYRLSIWLLLWILRWLLSKAIIVYVDSNKFSFVVGIYH